MNDVPAATLDEIVYPESDGRPMADNTLQWDWMVKIVGELRELFKGQEVFVAGDLFWYPVEGDPHTVSAPDAMVAFGRPPGYRGSYKQWKEGGIAPQVVFEVLSPSNTAEEMEDKFRWYDRFGVEEYYFLDPYANQLEGWIRTGGRLRPIAAMNGFQSPRLGIRFVMNGEVKFLTPLGREFQTREERVSEIVEELRSIHLAREEERERAILAERQAREAEMRAEEERNRAELATRQAQAAAAREKEAIRRAEQLAAKLRELGVNPDDLPSANS